MERNNKIRIATLIVFFGILLLIATHLHPFGVPVNTQMDDYFIRNGQAQTGSNNIVASILFDYRGLDTLGEAMVLFAAAAGVFLILGREEK